MIFTAFSRDLGKCQYSHSIYLFGCVSKVSNPTLFQMLSNAPKETNQRSTLHLLPRTSQTEWGNSEEVRSVGFAALFGPCETKGTTFFFPTKRRWCNLLVNILKKNFAAVVEEFWMWLDGPLMCCFPLRPPIERVFWLCSSLFLKCFGFWVSHVAWRCCGKVEMTSYLNFAISRLMSDSTILFPWISFRYLVHPKDPARICCCDMFRFG